MNKKGQSAPAGWAVWVGEFLVSVAISIGVLQLLFIPFKVSLEKIITTYFGGSKFLFFVIACGAIGMAVNELISMYYARTPLFNTRVKAFLGVGIGSLAVGLLIPFIAPTQAAAMLLP